jgi:hypothetical protein
MQTSRIALGALAISASAAACQPPEATSTSAAEDPGRPVVGRLITREGVIDLTTRAFADTQGPVPTGSYARLMADVDKGSVDQTLDARGTPPRPGAREDQDQPEPSSFLRRSF